MSSRVKRRKNVDEPTKLRLDDLNKDISIADIDINDLLYQPKSDLTAAVYELIIKFVNKKLGFQHDSIIKGAADELLGIMKNPSLDEDSRRAEVSGLVSLDGKLDDEEYNEICNLSKKIDDWNANDMKTREDTGEGEAGFIGIDADEDDRGSDEYSLKENSEDEFDLDEMFEKENKDEGNLDLEELAKKQLAVVPKVNLGEVVRKEGYNEYTIKPKKPKSYSENDLRLIKDLREEERLAFPGIRSLNYIQSRIYERAMGSDSSLLICAPTGAGKTNIALLTMLREILKYPSADRSGFDTSKFKMIYVAPIKALVQEIVENFTKKLGGHPFNLVVEELTGDHQLDQKQISRAQLIVCTPEKWDIVTRKSLDRLYTKLVRLVIFDEIHLLHNERGATLEALVARIKRHKYMEGEPIRIIGLSATLPNYKDVSRFISPEQSVEKSTFYFDSSHRPVPLRQQYIALTESKKVFKLINDIVYDKVIERLASHSKQILIFVHSRPDTMKTAEFLKSKALEDQKVGLFLTSDGSKAMIDEYGENINPKLRELLRFGLGTHHAGMSKYERTCVEELFRKRAIRVLVSTATLAWGVNLPARTVIIKGTQVYRDGRWTDLDSLDITQMLGRAGRPGHDSEGEGIVITQQSKVAFYVSIMTEQLPVESRLIGRLAEFINSECVIGNIDNLKSATNWIAETYLNSRMLSVLGQDNRQYMSMYGIQPEARNNDPDLEQHRRNLAYNAARILDERGLIVFDRNSGAISSTEVGRIASSYNCSSRTIKLFYDSISQLTTDIDLFRIFSLADEFKDIFVRRGEEADLATMINQVPFPIRDKGATPGADKVNVLLQVYIFRLNIEGSDLICDMHFIKDNAARLARAIHDIVLLKGHASIAELSLDLCRKIDLRMTACHSPLRQFPDDLDADIVKKLERMNYHIDELRVIKADKLTDMLRCDKRTGERVFRMLEHLPKLKIEASLKPISKSNIKVDLTITPNFSWSDKYHGTSERFWLFVEDVDQERLLHYEIVYVRKYMMNDKIRLSFLVPFLTPVNPFYYIRLFPDRWFGCDHHLPLYLETLTLPDEPVLHTQLLDIDPARIRALENPLFERYYAEKFKGADFNQIQTQSFKALYKSDEDVILLAAAGSGKTTCAELAVIHNINLRGTSSKCAYIAANPHAAQVVYENWISLFKHYNVMLLTGNHRADAARVDDSKTNIVIGDAEKWHILSLVRAKKYRKLFNKFQLFVIDDIHRLYSDRSSTLEWICSKIRLLTKLSGDSGGTPRIVSLGSPVACADSLRSWLALERGAKEPVLLNYPPSIRPVKLELVVERYHQYDYKMRLLTMQRPAYRLINQVCQNKPALIFVADFHQVCEMSETFARYFKSDGLHPVYPRSNLDSIRDPSLRESLRHGVGFVHLGMDSGDKRMVESLFESEQILVLLATVSSCWSLQCRSYLTIIMDTQQHDGVEASDYELTDIIQMVGLTGRPLSDHSCRCVVMCQYSKADLYERFFRDPLPIESELPANLISYVNYEISTGAIAELNDIYKPYLAHTYFYKRISINPNYYGIEVAPDQKASAFANFFNNLVNKVALELEKTELMTMEGSHENPTFTAGLLSKISLEYYINYATLVNYNKWLNADSNAHTLRPLELIELIASHTEEFKHQVTIKNGELPFLKYLQRRHRPREGDQLSERSFKIKLLILSQYQKTDGREDRVEGELVHDRRYIISVSYRLLMAIVDIAWLKDSFHLAKTAIQLARKLVPFYRATKPNIEMDISIAREEGLVKIDVSVKREDRPFSLKEFEDDYSELPHHMYREEGWCFLINGKARAKRDGEEKFVLFKRVKTPAQGDDNKYKLEINLTDNAESYIYELNFMSDFYSTSQDRRVADIDFSGVRAS